MAQQSLFFDPGLSSNLWSAAGQSDLASSVDTISRVVGSDSPPHYSCPQHNQTSNESLGHDSKQSVMVESLTKGQDDITPVPVTFNFVKHETIDSSSEQQSTPPLLKTLNSLNSNEQISSFPLSLLFNNVKQDLLNKHNEQHSSLPVPLVFNNVKQDLLNKHNEQHSSLPVPLVFNKIKTEILTDENEKHLYFPVPLTFNHVKQELLIKSREQLPSQNVLGPPTSTAPGSEVMECEFITTDLLKMGGLLDLQEQGKNIEQSKGSPKQQRPSSNVQTLCDINNSMGCISNESFPYSGLKILENNVFTGSSNAAPPSSTLQNVLTASSNATVPLSSNIQQATTLEEWQAKSLCRSLTSREKSPGYIYEKDSSFKQQAECPKAPHNEESFPPSCTICGKKFIHKNNLKCHMRIHRDPGIHCDICGVFLHKTHSLKDHRQKHFENKPHKCPTCFKGFSSPNVLWQHREIHRSGGVKKDHLCHLCGLLTTRYAFNTHLIRHLGIPKYICDKCGKVFRDIKGLKQHLTIHDVKTFTCAECNNSFKNRSSVSCHIRHIHPETMGLTEKVICPICGKYYSQSGIIAHLFYHNKGKTYYCDLCNKSFKTKQYLNKHMLVHTGEKKYQCELCGSKFKSKLGLTKHIKSSIHSKKLTQ